MAQCYLVVLLTLTSALLYQASAFTDPLDVTFLKNLYRELNYPQQLFGWNSGGGDLSEVSWKGISCNGSSVIFIQINGLELSGRLGDQLFNLVHLTQLNVSSIHIYGEIPASLLPPNATYMNLSFDYFGGNIPYSFSPMKYLCHLNLSHNLLSGPIGNVLSSLQNLKRMDLSNNNFTGDLPTSFQDLKNLTALNLPYSSYSKDLLTLFEEQEEKEEQQPSQPDQEQQQQPPQSEQEQQPQPQPDQEQQQHNGDEAANAGEDGGGNGEEAGEDGGGDGEENEGEGEEEEVEEEEDEEEENEEEEDGNVDQETKEADNFCRPDEPKTYGDDRLIRRIKRTITHFHTLSQKGLDSY